MWPTDEKNLCIYSDEEINFLCMHYKEVLEEKGITADGAHNRKKTLENGLQTLQTFSKFSAHYLHTENTFLSKKQR
ncbi:hypothetical protein PR048_004733 [Dryococelus australis]|uniref:Uncharacterized protein n=1 Tax=Dryococelus australis TaxID=614101 RepID=A0ABQ9I683_9NEOP|nr:hypothetical protein PR048_004733 [Dryococelus australis]